MDAKDGRKEILRFIMQRIKRKGDFPAISQYVSDVVRTAQSPNATARNIAQVILKDVSPYQSCAAYRQPRLLRHPRSADHHDHACCDHSRHG